MANVPFAVNSFLYMNGFELTNDASVSNTTINIAAGNCRDSTDVYQIITTAPINVLNTLSGLGGLDTGTVAASTLYSVYIVADLLTGLPTSAMISTNMTSPLMPYSYNSFRKVGYVRTDGSSHFLAGYWYGSNSSRVFMYDAPIATAVTAGAATTFTAVALTTFVPSVTNLPVWISTAFTPGAASRTLSMTPHGGTGTAVLITGQVTSVVVSSNSLILARPNTGAPSIDYLVANSGDAVAINVAGYQFTI